MSAYNAQRGPNVSEFIANLNAIPSAQDIPQENFNFDDDLAMFTNTQFFDFDLGQDADLQPSTLRFDEQAVGTALPTPDMAKSNMDFLQGKLNQTYSFCLLCCTTLHGIVIGTHEGTCSLPRQQSSLPILLLHTHLATLILGFSPGQSRHP
jgi:hypothetical protein